MTRMMDLPTAPVAADTRATSAQALQALGLREMSRRGREIFDVVLAAQRNGAQDMSLTEIRDAYERRHGRRVDVAHVSARVHGLIDIRWLARCAEARPCSVTGRMVHPVFVPAKQARLFA